MVISYKKLWKLLIDRDMKKKDLIAKSGISQSSVTKLGHNESVSTDIIVKICTALECDLTDIMELVPEEKCNHCKYLFESNDEVDQCLDCGKYAVRPATQTEIEEYESRDKNWDDGGD